VSVPIVQKLWRGGRPPPQLKASSSETPKTAWFVGPPHSWIRVWKTPKWFHKNTWLTNRSIKNHWLLQSLVMSVASPDIRTYGCKGIMAVGLADTAALRVGSCSCMITYSIRIYPYHRPLKMHRSVLCESHDSSYWRLGCNFTPKHPYGDATGCCDGPKNTNVYINRIIGTVWETLIASHSDSKAPGRRVHWILNDHISKNDFTWLLHSSAHHDNGKPLAPVYTTFKTLHDDTWHASHAILDDRIPT
jgi:hypothetical protein